MTTSPQKLTEPTPEDVQGKPRLRTASPYMTDRDWQAVRILAIRTNMTVSELTAAALLEAVERDKA